MIFVGGFKNVDAQTQKFVSSNYNNDDIEEFVVVGTNLELVMWEII
jgi:adenosylcobinamide amidohydrolase